MPTPALTPYRYAWPTSGLDGHPRWEPLPDGAGFIRSLPETHEELAADSRWPAFFPSPLCLVTAGDGERAALEKVVGASVVNRFPYTIALSFCRQDLSRRHHARRSFMDVLEACGAAAVQFLPPGPSLDRAMRAILTTPEADTGSRLAAAGLPTRPAETSAAPVFREAYMVYEARLVRPGQDFDGQPIHARPWLDVGSHRVYFLEINAIQLRDDIAAGRSQVRWRSLPAWRGDLPGQLSRGGAGPGPDPRRYQKGFTPHYAFPSPNTVAFAADSRRDGMAVLHLPPLPRDQVQVDNDRARWPCFFPSSVGMITTWTRDGVPNLMPCGSTTVLSRHPLVIAPCVSYARINARYAPRATLELIRQRGHFGCGVPFIHPAVIDAIKYCGTTSVADDPDKLARVGLAVERAEAAPVLPALPIHYECRVIGEVPLGTHVLFLGEVRRVRVRADVTPRNPLEWCPWADVAPADAGAARAA
jgi:flavin reductase (DIM6/NTAB) family NADH-FMN oxidoreductase RutF